MEIHQGSIHALEDSYLHQVTSYLPDMWPYLPHSITKTLSYLQGDDSIEMQAHFQQQVLYSHVQQVAFTMKGKKMVEYLCILGYSDGFMIWNITNLDDIRPVCGYQSSSGEKMEG